MSDLSESKFLNDSPSSSSEEYAIADPWTSKINRFLIKLEQDASIKRDLHDLSGHHFRKLEIRWSLPSVAIPSIFAPLTLLVGLIDPNRNNDSPQASEYVATLGFILTAICNSVDNFFRFGNRSARHHLYSAKYSDIVTDIQSEIVKKAKFRINADVFLTAMKMKYDNLVFGEPVIPKSIELAFNPSHLEPKKKQT